MRSLLLVTIVALAGSVLSYSQVPSGTAVSPFAQQLIDQQKAFLKAEQDKNREAAERAVAEDFRGIATNGDLYDKGEIVESAAQGMPKDTRAYDFAVVKLSGDAAVVAYNLIVPGAHPRYRHMADTWAHEGGQWKLKFRQITPNLWSATDLD
jgi:hypothetical protein